MTPAQVQAKVLREKLKAIMERANAATPGPWRLSSMGYSVVSDLHTEHDGDYCSTICSVHCGVRTTEKALKQFQDDGYFIGHSRTDIPALLDVVESLLQAHEKHISNGHSGMAYSEAAISQAAERLNEGRESK